MSMMTSTPLSVLSRGSIMPEGHDATTMSYQSRFLWALQRETTAHDWCEPNYTHSIFIAEFYNTLSNFLFLVFPSICMWLFHSSYVKPLKSPSCHIAFILFIVVGATSTYYHATLSLFGQILDEISILWVIVITWALWMPKEYFPEIFNKQRRRWQCWWLLVTVMITCTSWLWPALNAICLMGLAIPVTYIMARETRKTVNARVKTLGMRCIVVWCFAFTTWVTDRLHCPFWLSIGFPYMHALWHLLVCITSYQAAILLCYYNAIGDHSHEFNISLKLWPDETWTKTGIPYVHVEKRVKNYPVKMAPV